MLQTLFVIPHAVIDGWLLYGWLILGAFVMAYLFLKKPSQEVWSFLPIYLVVAVAIYFVLPQLEVKDYSGAPLGIAIRGYGACLLMGILGGVYISHLRCQRVGIDSEQVLAMMFWTVVWGIIGARVFYVVQKFDNFSGQPPVEMLKSILDMTKGGLVVYGSLIGGFIAGSLWLWRSKLPPLRVADAVAPGMVLGLAIGRLGCLMNGCCFGGVCDPELPNIHFPPGSPPYMQQLADGELFGMTSDLESEFSNARIVKQVAPGSKAESLGIQQGERIKIYMPDSLTLRAVKSEGAQVEGSELVIERESGRADIIPISDLPGEGVGIHPTQVYSSVNAFFLCLVLWFYFAYRKSDGEVFALMLILYSIGRFVLESIRTDELGVFGTPFTISQCVSFGILAFGIAMFVFVRSRGPRFDVSKLVAASA